MINIVKIKSRIFLTSISALIVLLLVATTIYWKTTKNNNIVLDFCGEKYEDSYVIGWATVESNENGCWRWADQKFSSLRIKVDPKYNYKMIFEVGNHAMNKKQSITITLGKIKIAKFPVPANEARRFEVFLSKDLFNDNFADIRFDFSENNSPSKFDNRGLALSFGKVEFIKAEE